MVYTVHEGDGDVYAGRRMRYWCDLHDAAGNALAAAAALGGSGGVGGVVGGKRVIVSAHRPAIASFHAVDTWSSYSPSSSW